MSEEAGKINVYHCEQCGKHIRTINMHDGTTPFTMTCECGHWMTSQFYRLYMEGEMQPVEKMFYYPTREQLDSMPLPEANYVLEGAMLVDDLASRPILQKSTKEAHSNLDNWKEFVKEVYGREYPDRFDGGVE